MAEPFPRSAAYDESWVTANRMGPNVLWLAESLAERMELEAGARVLDLGCGRAISSVFLAREFGAEVWATDLWIKPTENWERIQAAGLEVSTTATVSRSCRAGSPHLRGGAPAAVRGRLLRRGRQSRRVPLLRNGRPLP